MTEYPKSNAKQFVTAPKDRSKHPISCNLFSKLKKKH